MTNEYLPCVKRNSLQIIDKLGTVSTAQQCGHAASERSTQVVIPEDCRGCVLRVPDRQGPPRGPKEAPAQKLTVRDFKEPKFMPDGSLVYPRTGWEPPKVPEGYRRKNDDPRSPDAWVFLPNWPPCVDRVMYNKLSSCGCVHIHARCSSKEAAMKGKAVNLDDCRRCPLARASAV